MTRKRPRREGQYRESPEKSLFNDLLIFSANKVNNLGKTMQFFDKVNNSGKTMQFLDKVNNLGKTMQFFDKLKILNFFPESMLFSSIIMQPFST